LRQVRDEVHRFGISFHRKKRTQGTFRNELENIHGIGDSTSDTLLKTFRSVNKIATASEAELEKQIGKAKARLVWNYFHNNSAEEGVNQVN
jgi:excinuclease ABC subunit C